MKYNKKEAGRLTYREFKQEYQCYKDDFDIEIILKRTNTTYSELKKKIDDDEEWNF